MPDRLIRSPALLGAALLGLSLAPAARGQSTLGEALERLSARDTATEAERLGLLLEGLGIPIESQVAAFSRTSLQAKAIGWHNPRTIYFDEDDYVGFVPGTGIVEVMHSGSAPSFAVVDLDRATVRTETTACLQCHQPSGAAAPRVFLRSVHPYASGEVHFGAGGAHVDSTTPHEERWGGWLVTGAPEGHAHLGNRRLEGDAKRLAPESSARAAHPDRLPPGRYPTSTSDVVALLVLEHQARVHNALAEATARVTEAERIYGADHRSTYGAILDAQATEVARALLAADEPKLPRPIEPTAYARVYATRQGEHHLRELDLHTRLHRFRLSPLIYSEAFLEMPADLSQEVWLKVWMVLHDIPGACTTLPVAERTVILEIVERTVRDLPGFW